MASSDVIEVISDISDEEEENTVVKNLIEDFHRVSKTRNPSHVADRPLSFGDLAGMGGDEELGTGGRESGYTLYSTQGERNIMNVLRETDETNDQFIEQSLNFVHARAGAALVGDIPELESAIKGLILTDKHIGTRCTNMLVHEKGEYNMADLAFNLTPLRSHFMCGLSASVSEDIKRAMDEPCSNGEGCYYKRTHFPQAGVPGPVCFSNAIVNIVTKIMPMAPSALIPELCALLREKIVAVEDGGGNEIKKHYRLCIVCILIQQLVNQLNYNGTNVNGKGAGHDVFLVNVEADPTIGLKPFMKKNYFVDEVNIRSCMIVQQAKNLSFSNYDLIKTNVGMGLKRWVAFKK